jgi:hypothetical protein
MDFGALTDFSQPATLHFENGFVILRADDGVAVFFLDDIARLVVHSPQ